MNRNGIGRLCAALESIREGADDMPMQQALTLLAVAAQPGLTMQELGERVGMSQSSCSRNVAALSKWHRLKKPGAELVEAVEDWREVRRKVVYLTDKGKARVALALEALTVNEIGSKGELDQCLSNQSTNPRPGDQAGGRESDFA